MMRGSASVAKKLLLTMATTVVLLTACGPEATATPTTAPTPTTEASPTPTPPSIPDLEDLTLDDAPDLVVLLGHDSPPIRREAAALLMELTLQFGLESLADIGPEIEAQVPMLIEALQRAELDSSEVRWAAACALGWVGPEAAEAIPNLVDSLRDPEAEVRRAAVWALGRMGPQAAEAVQALVEGLRDEDPFVRSNSAWALGEMGPAAVEAVPAVIESLADEAPMVQQESIWALAQIAPESPEVLDALRHRLLDMDDSVAEAAAEALDSIAISLPTVEDVEHQYGEEVQPLAEALLAAGQGPGGADVALPGAATWGIMLVPLDERLHYVQTILYPEWTLGTDDSPTNLYVIYTCQRGEGLAHGIVPMTAETQEVIAEITLVAEVDGGYCVLEKQEGIGGAGSRDERDLVESAVQPLELLGSAGPEVEHALEMIVAYASGQAWRGPFESRQKVAALQQTLSSPYWADRKQAALALGALGADAMDAVPALIEALETSGSSVDPAIASALEDITGQDFGADAAAWQEWWEGQP